MQTYGIDDVRRVLLLIAGVMIENKDTFTDIDSKLGDGDMGISMEKGALALRQVISGDSAQETDPTKLLMACAAAFNREAPSTLGTLLSIGMMTIGKQLAGATAITGEQVADIPMQLADAIASHGKAQEGDKTILDALYPYARSFRQAFADSGSLRTAATEAAKAAHAGMEATKGRQAKMGRARWLAERNMEYPDGGAVLCDLVAAKLMEA